ncbi:hypothetical protein BN946_scf184801.g60 [Trametes cinnabarina]|uniref:Uncharacterized protein n=1 Tax=Pycnoporus cinnabarinus TaxID=5643 RepID=A0A060S8R8_PYCCI|nr:hypothetical protein BN946_scf184801.g60 [Trametes cinnabarina]
MRMLSAPSPSPPPSNPLPQPPSPAPSTINPYSLPPTPIGEPIISFQNDPSFLITTSTPPETPLSPSLPIPSRAMVPPPPEQSPEMRGITSLSPPPRRGSKQITVLRQEDSEDDHDEQPGAGGNGNGVRATSDDGTLDSPIRKPLSLSPHQSVTSLEDVCI